MNTALSYEESFKFLNEKAGIFGELRPLVTRLPRFDDDPPGPSIFRSLVEDAYLKKLTMPGLFIGRSELRNVSFAGSNLRLSVMNWSTFTKCVLSDCNLSDCDLRASEFLNCSFIGADLSGADLRGAIFTGCSFDGAIFEKTKLYRAQKRFGLFKTAADQESLPISKEQRAQAAWLNEVPEPEGG